MTENGAEGLVTAVIVSGLPPVFAIVTGNDDVVPVVTEPNASVAGVTESTAAGRTPVPLIPTDPEPTELVTVSVAFDVVAAVGAYATVADTDAPAAIVAPTAGKPVTLYGALRLVTAVIVNGLPPVFAIVTLFDDVVPVVMLPNVSVAGDTESTAGGNTPVPVSDTEDVPAELTTVNVPLEAVAATGAKFTVAVTDCPAAMLVPAAGRPVAEKGAAGLVVDEIVSGLPPVFAMVTVRGAVVPVVTLPNAIDAGVTDSTPGPADPDVIETLETAC